MFYKVRHIGIVTSKFTKCSRIFQNIFGFKKIKKKKIVIGKYIDNLVALKNVKLNVCYFRTMDGHNIELLHYTKPKSLKKKIKSNNLGVSHLAFAIKDYESFKDKIKSENIKPLGKIQISEDKKVLVAYYTLLDEILLEVVQEIKKN
jgi:hypothetical protein